jgi:solute carrier family 8 (sodium/calcium exchanger)
LSVALLLLLLYVFLGLAVATDIFMDAINKITSKTEKVEVKGLEGKSMIVEVPVWNPRIANVALLALGSAAPEIFLSFFSTVTNIESVPNALGPMVLVGSAAFNLLVVSGISILAVSEIKKVFHLNAFLVTFAFATFAFVWLFLVLIVFSPAYIEFWEAMTTLAFYPLLLFFVWATEKCSPEGKSEAEQIENNRRLICKQSLRDLAEAKGKMYVLDAVTNNSGAPEDVGRIQEYFKTCLDV